MQIAIYRIRVCFQISEYLLLFIDIKTESVQLSKKNVNGLVKEKLDLFL